MAKRIKETPVLYGKDAERFSKKIKENEGKRASKDEYNKMRANYNKLKKFAKFWCRLKLPDFVLQRLEPDSPRKPFDCGDPDLNEFFLNDSIDHSRQLLAVTYALESEDETVAYFSVLNDSIRKGDTTQSRLKEKILKWIPFKKRGYKSHPAVKVGRFAVSKNYQNQAIGTQLMDYIKGYFIDNNKTGCRFITVDSYNNEKVIKFYQNNGFDFLTNDDKSQDRRIMFFDLIILTKPSSDLN